jgi:RNA polymerase sigma factor (sigma-70 family)
MTPIASDDSLLDGLNAGRRDAFVRLYAEHHAAIYNLCARIVGDREEAKDLTQETFIAAFAHLQDPNAQPMRKLRPWLYRVAANACFNHMRSRKRLAGGGDAQLENAASGVDEFAQAQTVALVEQSLGEMNERYRTALVLKDLQGLPPEEIAEVMEISRPTADVLVHRARASFKAAFAKLAGSDAAPAALGLVLLPLSVPAALQAMPPLPAHLAPVHAPVHPGIPATAGPAGAGLLTQIGAALTTKAAIGAAAAALVIGGGVVAVKEADRSHSVPAAAAVSTPHAGVTSQPPSIYTGLHDGHWAGHGTPMGEHGGAAHHAEPAGHHAGGHSGSGSHDSATHDAGENGGSTMTTHDSTTSTSHAGDHSTTTTTTHEGGDMTGSHDGGD